MSSSQFDKRSWPGLFRFVFALPFALGVGTALPAVDSQTMRGLIRAGDLAGIAQRLQLAEGEQALVRSLGFQNPAELRIALNSPWMAGLLEALCTTRNTQSGSGQPHHSTGLSGACHAVLPSRKQCSPGTANHQGGT